MMIALNAAATALAILACIHPTAASPARHDDRPQQRATRVVAERSYVSNGVTCYCEQAPLDFLTA